MSLLESPIALDTWTSASWDEFVQLIEQPEHKEHRAYYHQGRMRIETMPVGSDHATDHSILILLIGLFGMLKGIPLKSRDACSYRLTSVDEFQPDISYYIGEGVNTIPRGTRVVNLDVYPMPDLVIEVSDTTLADDKGEKRLQYESLRIPEYWIWDVKNTQIVAFSIAADGSSKRIDASKVLPELPFGILSEALRRSQVSDNSAASNWFMEQLNR